MSDPTADHYDRLSSTYDDNWEHSAEFLAWMTDCIVRHLLPQDAHTVVDVGGGTGIYARRILANTGRDTRVICTDPSQPMLDAVPADAGLEVLHTGASDLPAALASHGLESVDRILVKEAVHHFPDMASDLHGLAGLLSPGGRIVVAMLPPTIDYPLFAAALDRYEQLQPHFNDVADALRDAELDVTVDEEAFPLSFPPARYITMVRNRYMSLLSTFTDQELDAGVEEMEGRYGSLSTLEFSDRFIFVTGTRVAV